MCLRSINLFSRTGVIISLVSSSSFAMYYSEWIRGAKHFERDGGMLQIPNKRLDFILYDLCKELATEIRKNDKT